jgi:integrase
VQGILRMGKQIGKWRGGRVFEGRDGPSYIIEKMVGGKRYSVTLDVSTEFDAVGEFALFMRDPAKYVQKQKSIIRPLAALIDDETIGGCLGSLEARGRSREYLADLRRYLLEWGAAFKGRDLHEVDIMELRRYLFPGQNAPTSPRHRIAAIKTFTSYLEQVGQLDPAKDPTAALKLPEMPAPEKNRRRKGYDADDLERFYAVLRGDNRTDWQAIRDVFLLHCKTGLHDTEIRRFAAGVGELRAVDMGEIRGVLEVLHKSGRRHLMSLDAQAHAAAARLKARGSAPSESYMYKRSKEVCENYGWELIRFGEIRHTFVTLGQLEGVLILPTSGGVALQQISQIVGHHSVRTTDRHYNLAVPPMVKLPILLKNVDDPQNTESSVVLP